MVSGNKSKAVRNARAAVVTQRSAPWGLIAGTLVVVLFAAGVFGFYYSEKSERDGTIAALAPFTPTAENQDPARTIPGVVVETYQGGSTQHVDSTQVVAYTKSPPFGGAHDVAWATCTGVVYPEPVRNENMVHSLEHAAVWIAYNPDQVSGSQLELLASKVEGKPYMVMSPYPGLDSPISLQAWGHQLKLDDAADPRVDQFVFALQRNPYISPEPRGTCNEVPGGTFAQFAPPAFQPAPSVSDINGSTIMPEAVPGG